MTDPTWGEARALARVWLDFGMDQRTGQPPRRTVRADIASGPSVVMMTGTAA